MMSSNGILTLTTFVSLDGVMQAPGGPTEDTSGGFPHGGWVAPLADADMGRAIVDIFERAGAFLLGRGTYDIFAGHWPRIAATDDPVATKLNALPKYVASRTRSRFDWNNSHHMRDVESEIDGLKRTCNGELQVHGSAGLAQTLLTLDAVDEYRLFVFPVVIGQGKRLFGKGAIPSTMKLLHSEVTSTGAMILRYRRTGDLRTGSFQLD